MDALARIRAERKLTTVTVAHRLTTILNSDKIVVIAEGSIQESGTHKELVNLGGIYATLCEGQGLTADAADHAKDTAPTEAVEVSMTQSISAGDEADEEKAMAESDQPEEKNEDTEDDIDTSEVSSRLWQYSKADIGYSILGYSGGIIVGGLPAGEAILFGLITGNFFVISDADQMRSTNYELSLWFLLLAFLSFVGNVSMGIGFGVGGCRLTRRMRVLVFDKLMRYPMGWYVPNLRSDTSMLVG